MTAGVLESLYWITALSGILYSGSKAMDPEFGRDSRSFSVSGNCELECFRGLVGNSRAREGVGSISNKVEG